MRLPDLPGNVGSTKKTKRLWYMSIAGASATLLWSVVAWLFEPAPPTVTAATTALLTILAAGPEV